MQGSIHVKNSQPSSIKKICFQLITWGLGFSCLLCFFNFFLCILYNWSNSWKIHCPRPTQVWEVRQQFSKNVHNPNELLNTSFTFEKSPRVVTSVFFKVFKVWSDAGYSASTVLVNGCIERKPSSSTYIYSKESVQASASLWQTQWKFISRGLSCFNLAATPFVVPVETAAPSGTNDDNFLESRPHLSMF